MLAYFSLRVSLGTNSCRKNRRAGLDLSRRLVGVLFPVQEGHEGHSEFVIDAPLQDKIDALPDPFLVHADTRTTSRTRRGAPSRPWRYSRSAPSSTSPLTTSGRDPFVSSFTLNPCSFKVSTARGQALVHGGLAPGDHHPLHPFPEFSQAVRGYVEGHVLHRLGTRAPGPCCGKKGT